MCPEFRGVGEGVVPRCYPAEFRRRVLNLVATGGPSPRTPVVCRCGPARSGRPAATRGMMSLSTCFTLRPAFREPACLIYWAGTKTAVI